MANEVKKFERGRSRWYPCPTCLKSHPSVTTLLGVIGSGALTGWIAKNSTTKLNLFSKIVAPYMEDELHEKAKREAAQEWSKREDTEFWKSGWEAAQGAANYGVIAHAAVESFLQGKSVDRENLPEQSRRAFDSFRTFFDDHKVEMIATEKTFYNCQMNYAGTADFVGNIDGELTLGDWKTSNSIFMSHVLQCRAYCLADETQSGDRLYGQILVGRFGKDGSSDARIFKRNEFPSMEDARKIMESCGHIFRVQNEWEDKYPYKKKEK